MKCLKEPLSRLANREEQTRGAFFEGRFKSVAILDEESLLATCAYIDLNPVASGIAAGGKGDGSLFQAREPSYGAGPVGVRWIRLARIRAIQQVVDVTTLDRTGASGHEVMPTTRRSVCQEKDSRRVFVPKTSAYRLNWVNSISHPLVCAEMPRYFARISHQGKMRNGDVPGSIGVLEALDKFMPIGEASCRTHNENGLAVWTLRIGKEEIPGGWVIVDRRFRLVK